MSGLGHHGWEIGLSTHLVFLDSSCIPGWEQPRFSGGQSADFCTGCRARPVITSSIKPLLPSRQMRKAKLQSCNDLPKATKLGLGLRLPHLGSVSLPALGAASQAVWKDIAPWGCVLGAHLVRLPRWPRGTPAVFPVLRYQPAGSAGLGPTGCTLLILFDAQMKEPTLTSAALVFKAVPAGGPTLSPLLPRQGKENPLFTLWAET